MLQLDRRKRIPLLGKTGKAQDIRKGLVLYFEEEIREDVSDLREAFTSDRRMVLNNDRRTAKISVFPNPVGKDTKTSLPWQNAKIASIC